VSVPLGITETFSKIKLVIFDFDGVFTDNTVYVDENGVEQVRCSRADGFGLQKLRQVNVGTLVLSTEVNPVVSARCKKLKIDCVQGCPDKARAFNEIIQQRNIAADQVAYVGNDINDQEIMKLVGFPIAVADAYPEVLNASVWITTKPGGLGAVREFCDHVYNAKVNHAGTFQS
jgi:3-deoxy-D-manno-octulosonate 8-phosphate phosphatase (KDO 8-P phosphatase)